MKRIPIVLLMLVATCVPGWAALGQIEGSVSLDQAHMKSADNVRNLQAYKVHELTTSTGAVVREFVSSKGVVFGVAWQSPFMPDMRQILGDYVNNLQTATKAQTQVHARRSLIVKTNDLVFVSFGRLRFYQGHAYVPSMVPSNVSVEVVK